MLRDLVTTSPFLFTNVVRKLSIISVKERERKKETMCLFVCVESSSHINSNKSDAERRRKTSKCVVKLLRWPTKWSFNVFINNLFTSLFYSMATHLLTNYKYILNKYISIYGGWSIITFTK